ncbi:MAG: hypothetical protein JWN98_1535, partial [Abditibacteriota bacterium]|nr:hypothetical protein [Abditibacteriota bacterium]
MIRTPLLVSLFAGAAVFSEVCAPSVTHASEVITLGAPTAPLLSRLRDFRTSLRTGQAPTFEWKLGAGDGTGLKMQIGAQPLPVSELLGLRGSAPAVGISSGKILIGSTAPMNFLDRNLGARESFLSTPGAIERQG